MPDERVSKIMANWKAGALTDLEALSLILNAAGEGDAEAVFGSLPEEWRETVAHSVQGVDPAETFIVESYCGSASHEEYAADLKRREELGRRGIAALQRIIARDANSRPRDRA